MHYIIKIAHRTIRNPDLHLPSFPFFSLIIFNYIIFIIQCFFLYFPYSHVHKQLNNDLKSLTFTHIGRPIPRLSATAHARGTTGAAPCGRTVATRLTRAVSGVGLEGVLRAGLK